MTYSKRLIKFMIPVV